MASAELERIWNTTAKLVFGSELGRLDEFTEWLSELPDTTLHKKSSISGKDVTYSVKEYCAGSKRAGLDEIDYAKKFPPLSINDIKDVDSLLAAVRERIYYTGGVVLGNSKFVEQSSNISESFFVSNSHRVDDSKYVWGSSFVKQSECVFGCNYVGASSHMVRGILNYRCKRTLELWNADSCSDCYYGHNLHNCSDCFFCFNLRAKRHAIGNLELGREKYSQIKQKLLGEIVQGIKSRKKLPSLAALAIAGPLPNVQGIALPPLAARQDMAPMEKAFSKTASLILGKRYGGIEKHATWLNENILGLARANSVASGRGIFVSEFNATKVLPKERLLSYEEAEKAGSISASAQEIESLSFANSPSLLGKIGLFTAEFKSGVGENLIDCPIYADGANSYRCFDCTFSKYCAYCFWPRDSEHLFGTSLVYGSSFCLKCYNSAKLQRCFEVDSSRNCSGCYFCHNCENVHDSMFCFNVKNMKYAIGNAEVGAEKFAAAKKMLLSHLQKELDAKAGVGINIFNIGCHKTH